MVDKLKKTVSCVLLFLVMFCGFMLCDSIPFGVAQDSIDEYAVSQVPGMSEVMLYPSGGLGGYGAVRVHDSSAGAGSGSSGLKASGRKSERRDYRRPDSCSCLRPPRRGSSDRPRR